MNRKRPISPHLQVYKIFAPNMASGLSITHRIAGIGLFFGLFYMYALIIAFAISEEAYNNVINFLTFEPVFVTLIALSIGYIFYLVNGVRFLLFNAGYLLSAKQVKYSGWVSVIVSIILIALVWAFIDVRF